MRSSRCWTAVAAAMCSACAASGQLISIDFTAAGQGVTGNRGLSFRPISTNGNPAPLVLTARSSIDETLPFDPFALGKLGTVFIDGTGTGAQDQFGGGSREISGAGPHSNEEVILTFDFAVPRDSLVLFLSSYRAGRGLLDRDDPAIFVFLVGGRVRTFDEFSIGGGDVAAGGGTGTLDLSALLASADLVEKIVVRETHKHLELGGITFVPAPATLALLGLPALVCAGRRRRRAV